MKKEGYQDTTYSLAKAEQKPDQNDNTEPRIIRGLLWHLSNGSLEEYLREIQRRKIKVEEWMFARIASAIPDIPTLKSVERQLNICISPTVMHRFFVAQSSARSLTGLRQLCDEARKEGFVLDWSVVDPVINRICRECKSPTDADIEVAIQLYMDARHFEETHFVCERDKAELRRYYTFAAHNLVLRLTSLSDETRHVTLAWEIAQQLRRSNPAPNRYLTGAYANVALRQAKTCEDAITAYHTVRSEMQSKLDAFSYNRLLATYFCVAKTDPNGFVPVFRGYFAILKDMVEDGVKVKPSHYLTLFQHLRKAADVIMDIQDDMKREQLRQPFLNILHRIRTRFVDEREDRRSQWLLCQVMHIYALLSHFDGSLEVWDSIRKTQIPTNTTLCVFLDVCGFAREPDLALATKEELESIGYVLNGNNWLSLLECLCRCGRIDEATYQFIHHSPRGPDGQPDRVAALLLLSQAYGQRQLLATRRLLRSHFPSLMIVQEDDSEFDKVILARHFKSDDVRIEKPR
jgi:hypothetical protein